MRIILYTGKGGVGKTSVAAATAVKCAESGYKTLLVSADDAHSLSDSLDITLSCEPISVLDNLFAQEMDATLELRRTWGKVAGYLTDMIPRKYVGDVTADELPVFPGFEELLKLSRIVNYYTNNDYDLIIIDCAPTGETLAMLSFPEIMRWWLERIRQVRGSAGKVAGRISDHSGIVSKLINDMDRACRYLDKMRLILTNRETTSIRLVTNPEKMAVWETRRSFTYLNMNDFNVDAVIVNKVIPDAVYDNRFSKWKEIQKSCIKLISECFDPVPIRYVPWFESEAVGVDMHRRTATELFRGEDPAQIKYNNRTFVLVRTAEGYILSVFLPFADKNDLSLDRKGDEFIIRSGGIKRNVMLPRVLADMTVSGAKFEEDRLNVKFIRC